VTIFARVYPTARVNMLNGLVNLAGTEPLTYKLALFTSSYMPSDSDATSSGINSNEVASGGYTTGGIALSSVAVTKVEANS
jgi:hypothetical protein